MKYPYTILIPHYKQGQATAHAVAKCIEHSKDRDIKIVVTNNSSGDNSINHILLTNLRHECRLISYPPDRLQSHGIALDWALMNGLVTTDWFIMLESDAYPSKDTWLDFYDEAIEQGFHSVGSLLHLSGGQYMHPCGALYNYNVWKKAFDYCREIETKYYYFPNMIMKEGHPCHAMVRRIKASSSIINYESLLSVAYKDLMDNKVFERIWKRATDYSPTINPFHNGMGTNQETISTYGKRNVLTEPAAILLDGKEDVITRMGYEPGQWFCYWMMANDFKVGAIPTHTEWMENRVNQQQKYTETENGVIHLWGVSSYYKADIPDLQDIIDFKRQQMADLYNSLPDAYKL